MKKLIRAFGVTAALFFILGGPADAQDNGDEPPAEGEGEGAGGSFGTSLPDIPPGEHGDFFGGASIDSFDEFQAAVTEGFSGDEGSSLTGPCGGTAISYDGTGIISVATDAGDDAPPVDENGEQAFTQDDPFEVDTQDDESGVAYFGNTGSTVFNKHGWDLTVLGISGDDGGDDNPQNETMNKGIVKSTDYAPFPMTALIKVKGQISDAEDQCEGEGWVKLVGPNPLLTPIGAVAAASFFAGTTGMLFNLRPAQTF